jgi:hypothetical protein
VPEPYNVRARENDNSALLSVTKAAYDKLVANYPEQSDVIVTSLLYQYALTRDGEESEGQGSRKPGGDDESYMMLRSAIKVCCHLQKFDLFAHFLCRG